MVCVFLEPAGIEHHEVGFALDQRLDFVGRQRRRVAARLDQFAERLGVGIDVLEQFVARRLPALQPAIELANVGVAQRREPSAAWDTRPSPSS